MKITFKVSPKRKQTENNDFNGKLSSYWKELYYAVFRRW